jgi:hypothetical protein
LKVGFLLVGLVVGYVVGAILGTFDDGSGVGDGDG